jgi:peptidoglycan LD-endopeptidase CwlK
MTNKYIFLIAGIIGIIFLFRNKIMSYYSDKISLYRVDKLHPIMRSKVIRFLNDAIRLGINLRLTSGLRTFEEQNELYSKGRPIGKIVTNAKAGESYHNYGLAFDVALMDENKPNWNYNDPRWDKIGKLGKSLGFKWGGDFKTISDKPHFEYNVPIAMVKNLYYNVPLKEGYVNLT